MNFLLPRSCPKCEGMNGAPGVDSWLKWVNGLRGRAAWRVLRLRALRFAQDDSLWVGQSKVVVVWNLVVSRSCPECEGMNGAPGTRRLIANRNKQQILRGAQDDNIYICATNFLRRTFEAGH